MVAALPRCASGHLLQTVVRLARPAPFHLSCACFLTRSQRFSTVVYTGQRTFTSFMKSSIARRYTALGNFRAPAVMRLAAMLLALCLFGGNGAAGPPPRPRLMVASVTVTPPTASIDAGQAQQFTATAKDPRGNLIRGLDFQWTSHTPSAATVNASGMATAQNQGTAHITATLAGIAGSATLTTQPPTKSRRISLSPPTATTRGPGLWRRPMRPRPTAPWPASPGRKSWSGASSVISPTGRLPSCCAAEPITFL